MLRTPIQKSEEQVTEMKEQTGQLAGEVTTLREELQQDFQQAIKQLSEVMISSLYTVDVGATFRPLLMMTHDNVATVYWMGTT